MTKEAGLELKKARIAAKIPVYVMAQRCYTSERTVTRWEDGEADPTPDDVDRYAEAVVDPTLWDRWMRMTYDSYGRRYPEGGAKCELPMAILRSRFELQDVLDIQAAVERDAIDGRIDDLELKARYKKEIQEVFAAARDVLELLD